MAYLDQYLVFVQERWYSMVCDKGVGLRRGVDEQGLLEIWLLCPLCLSFLRFLDAPLLSAYQVMVAFINWTLFKLY